MTKILVTKRTHGCGYIQSVDFAGDYRISPDCGPVDWVYDEQDTGLELWSHQRGMVTSWFVRRKTKSKRLTQKE